MQESKSSGDQDSRSPGVEEFRRFWNDSRQRILLSFWNATPARMHFVLNHYQYLQPKRTIDEIRSRM